MTKPDNDWPRSCPPEPPPMRIGDRGDTIDRAGVRRKADGTLRNFTMDAIRLWGTCVWIALMVLAVISYVMHT